MSGEKENKLKIGQEKHVGQEKGMDIYDSVVFGKWDSVMYKQYDVVMELLNKMDDHVE